MDSLSHPRVFCISQRQNSSDRSLAFVHFRQGTIPFGIFEVQPCFKLSPSDATSAAPDLLTLCLPLRYYEVSESANSSLQDE